jgi:hypothetical protein
MSFLEKVPHEIMSLYLEVRKTQKTLLRIMELNPTIVLPTIENLEKIEEESFEEIKHKFPELKLSRS